MNSCVIDGVRCTACCRATVLSRRIFNNAVKGKTRISPPSDFEFIKSNWQQMSRRRAKKKNTYQVLRTDAIQKKLREKSASIMWFYCKRVTDKGCGVYDGRPEVCKLFPRYTHSDSSWNEYVANSTPEYHPKCTEHVPVVILDAGDKKINYAEAVT